MKQIKFRHLATLGLCCSLLANSFTGIMAIAETVTIESSPTAETVASEATTETEKKTKVEQTEQAIETKNQQEQEKSKSRSQEEIQKEESETDIDFSEDEEVKEQEEDLKENFLPQTRWIANDMLYPRIKAKFLDEQGNPFTDSLNFSGKYYAVRRTSSGDAYSGIYDLTSGNQGNGNYILNLNNGAGIPMSPQLLLNYAGNPTIDIFHKLFFKLTEIKIAEQLKYVDSISFDTNSSVFNVYFYTYKYKDGTFSTTAQTPTILDGTSDNAKLLSYTNTNGYFINKNSPLFFMDVYVDKASISDPNGAYDFRTFGFNDQSTTQNQIHYTVTRKQVTEKFVDGTGVAITPPTGFTQNKKTPMTNNNFTYTSAKALPDTYQANGKTYKFKGWYKGKTKPTTLETSKTPSYKVTYDDTDDLNVVYEEIKAFDFPALTYQFGFVDESGKRVDASTIGLTYDKWRGEGFATNAADSGNPANWKTVSLEKGQIAPTKNNLKEITYPAQSFEILNDRSTQYSAANLTFTLPKHYEKISVYNKSGTFDVAYPFPSIYYNNKPEPINGGASWFQLKKSGSQSFVFNQTHLFDSIQAPAYMREIVSNPNLISDVGTYYTIDKPIYYHLTNRKVTENFVDASGTKITPPTGFTQGNQIPMTSDTFKYTAAKALPTSYTADGKTYLFQGWYKGKTKPNTLTTSTTPTYDTTFDDNDDMTAVYKEASISANLTMRGAVDVIDNGGTMEYWEVLLKNTGEAPL
ncbi:WxL domain-containing protein, partial [Enterococcus faecalis]